MFGETPLYENPIVTTSVTKYAEAQSSALPESLVAHREWTIHDFKDGDPDLMISPLQAQFQIWLARALRVSKVLEVGCYTGYSALGWAHAVRDKQDPKVVTLEFSPKPAAAARDAFAKYGVDGFVEVVEGDARQTIKTIAGSGQYAPFDMVFVDADKASYPLYLEMLLQYSQPGAQKRLLRPGAFILADNVLRRGLVANDSEHNPYHADPLRTDPEQLAALRKYNEDVQQSGRLENFLLPLFDGIHMAQLID